MTTKIVTAYNTGILASVTGRCNQRLQFSISSGFVGRNSISLLVFIVCCIFVWQGGFFHKLSLEDNLWISSVHESTRHIFRQPLELKIPAILKTIIPYFFAVIFLLFVNNLNAQTDFKKYLNDSIKFETVYARNDEDARISASELVLKTNLGENIKDSFFKQSNKEILSYLKDSATCWATNLLLYEKFKDLPLHYLNDIKNRQDWEADLKPFDIANWTKQLKKRRSK
jgi:hypothetical protein